MYSRDNELLSALDEMRKFEDEIGQGIEQLLALGQLDNIVFFACMLTERGRRRIDNVIAGDSAILFSSSAAMPARKTGLLELDNYIEKMTCLHAAETAGGGHPNKTISVVKQAYPEIYRQCCNHASHTDTLFIFEALRKRKAPKHQPAMESGAYYMSATVIWLCLAMRIDMALMDNHLAYILYQCIHEDERLYEYYYPAVEGIGKQKPPAMSDPLMPCLTVRCSDKITADIMRTLYNIVRLAGSDLDVVKLVESASIRPDEESCMSLLARNRGYSEGDLTAVFLVIRQLLRNQSYQTKLLDETTQKLADAEKSLSEVITVDDTVQDIREQLANALADKQKSDKENQNLHQQNKGLCADLAAANRRIRELEAASIAHRADVEELAELRETLYLMMQDKDAAMTDEEYAQEISFPYTDIPDGVVVFGGNDPWRNGMGECFPDIRFVPINFRYDVAIIRNASCVWVHPGVMTHKMFYSIIRDARANGTKVHYFRSLSVPSSARLLVDTLT